MKRIGLLFLSIMLLIGNVAAQDVMVVTKKDGTKTTFNINSVQDISFIKSEDINISISEIVPTSTTSFLVKYSIATVGKINECGICYGLDETADANKITGTIENGEGSVEIDGRDFCTTIYLRAYANIDGELYYSDIISHTTSTRFPTAKIIDLGLSVKWANHNLGAVNEEDFGSYLPWGDVSGNAYSSSSYPSGLNITQSCISGTKYDIVTHQWGDEWRMPTHEEFLELWNNTTKEFISSYGHEKVYAVKFTASNGNFIILPLAGFKQEEKLYGSNFGHYWTADLLSTTSGEAKTFIVVSADGSNTSSAVKWNQMLIRPVHGKRADTEIDGVEREYVDLGLSRLWAKHNYGANKPSERGTYVAWGEEQEKDEYNQSNYTHYKDGAFTDFDKSLTDSGIDVVANNWGGKWHTPTYAELEELRTGCDWTWTTEDGVAGYKVTSKTNGNSIFLPVTGEKFEKSQYYLDYGRYWTSEQYVEDTEWAYILSFSDKAINLGGKTKYRGCVIRPVRKR